MDEFDTYYRCNKSHHMDPDSFGVTIFKKVITVEEDYNDNDSQQIPQSSL